MKKIKTVVNIFTCQNCGIKIKSIRPEARKYCYNCDMKINSKDYSDVPGLSKYL